MKPTKERCALCEQAVAVIDQAYNVPGKAIQELRVRRVQETKRQILTATGCVDCQWNNPNGIGWPDRAMRPEQ